ncbi:2,3-bisphosphoglycerate-dependent phosphoglycerate mutase [Thermosporothrix hazakensis]|jgi:2,3-bisphosphoglycerate-dependent phosphoglycerate mutase|uniref:2,3-bisphosphoglycerate-dependent phosphoglycerate mutase n=1 Tax=Thermosporothrix hazakensis TaxID=644383 RepID=A0A326U8K2_THEHA|nr:histidine phosphatase family protein [Thermosporothrix hazakensis]PZW30496.1 2,3-bisphosphoglycerate-dependent phosphoglycerate mutase [Thermosporothrix hazakensis]GCE49356.1 phosphoglycerate mutase [Thermosporothrix hazakensis]
MEKVIYIVRHCEALGQAPEAPLSVRGKEQAEELAAFLLQQASIERIISSPYKRAVDSIAPLARELGLEIELDERLKERVLSAGPLENWLECLRQSFVDVDLCFEGGESGRAAQKRARAVVQEALATPAQSTLLVSHGNLTALLLHSFDTSYGFETWKMMTNPDVFCVTMKALPIVERIWQKR